MTGNTPFKIVITAVDKATATVHKINQSFDRLTRPIRRLNRSIKALGRASGFDRLGIALRFVTRTARDLAGQLRSIAAPMLALRGAAQAAGLSAQALDGGLKSLGESLEDALHGRNARALVTLNRLGIGIHKTAAGAIDTKRALLDLSSVIAQIKSPQVQGLVARTFGVESLLPLLRQGAEAIEAYQKRVAELGGVMSADAVQAAEQFGLSLHFLGIATQSVKNALGEKLLPILQPLIDRLTDWIGKNRELIATKVAAFVERLVRWLERLDFERIGADLKRFIQKVEDAVHWLGGWKNAALLVAVAMNGSLIASVLNLGFALGRLGLVMWANPILAAIGAIAVGIVLICKNWNGLTRKIKDTLDGFGRWKSAAGVLLAYFVGTWAVGMLRAIGKVGKAFTGISLASKVGLAAASGVGGWEVGNAIRPYLDEFIKRKSGGKYWQLWDMFTGTDRTKPFTQAELDRARGGRGARLTPAAQRQLDALNAAALDNKIAQAVAFFEQKGWTHKQAAGIVANLKIESGLNPKAVGDGGKAYGIAQWHPPRQAEFRRAFGKDIRAATLTEQLEFQNHELTQGLEQKAGRLLRGARSAYEAARLFSDYCERPLNKQAEAMKRGQEAIRIAQMPHLPQGMLLAQEDKRTDRPRDVRRLNTAQPLFPSIVQQPAQAARGTEYNAQTAQKMQIELTLNGFPEGISAQARSAYGQEIPVRIGYSLPNEVSV